MLGDLNKKVVVVLVVIYKEGVIIGDVDIKDIDSGNLIVKFIIFIFVL